jgi:uncharacterized protein (DUF3820 family)
VQPIPLAGKRFHGQPDFTELNLLTKPLEPGDVVSAYHVAQPFTRFYGSLASDQPLEMTLAFSNEEVDVLGNYVTDENITTLNFDAEGLKQAYDPLRQGQTGKFFSTIYGRYIRVEVKNVGKQPTKFLRAFIRGSVF